MTRLALVLGFVSLTLAAYADKTKPEVHLSQPDIKWAQPYGPDGPAFGYVAGAFGDKKPASFFVRFPAGADSGWHIHDGDYEAVVLKGIFTAQQQGDAAETALPAGTFFTEPGKKNHRNGCHKDSECLVFVHMEHGASNHATTADGKLVHSDGK